MNKTLKIEIDPFLCADQRRIFSGKLKYQDMSRIQGEVDDSTPDIQVDIEFAREGKFIVATGRIQGYLVLQCAACLEAVQFPIDIDVRLVVINDESLIELTPQGFEPQVFEGEKLVLSEVIEDELVLAMPDIARHDVCPVALPTSSTSKDFVVEQDVKENPFKALEGFKKN